MRSEFKVLEPNDLWLAVAEKDKSRLGGDIVLPGDSVDIVGVYSGEDQAALRRVRILEAVQLADAGDLVDLLDDRNDRDDRDDRDDRNDRDDRDDRDDRNDRDDRDDGRRDDDDDNYRNNNKNYNNNLKMDSLPLRVVRIARQLSVTPIELVEPILADLPLHRVLDLLSTHYGIGSTSGDGGGALEAAITNSHVWPTLAQANRVRLKALCVVYNQFSLFMKGRRAAHVRFAPSYFKSSSPSLRGTPAGRDLVQTMADDLNDSIVRYILVKERFTHQGTKLRDVCAYLPVAEDLSRFWRPIDPAEFRWMWMQDKQDWSCWQVKDNNEWTVDDTVRLIREAQRDLNHAKAEELRRLASLYELFPTYLKTPKGPPTPRQNLRHIPQLLRSIARKPTRLRHWFHPIEELEWLESFLWCVERMETQFPAVALELKAASIQEWHDPNDRELPLLEEADFRRFIDDSYTFQVAEQLKADLKSSRKGTGKLPSLVALYLPPFSSPHAREIAADMCPKADLRSGVRQMMYEEMVKTIKGRLSQPHDVDLQDGQGEIQPYQPTKNFSNHRRTCSICHTDINQPHKTFGSMCVTCGDFNLAERALSLPENLSLAGQTALVTGARVNLGFHTALRLLRCGAFLIASSRYPEDALTRYQKESDFDSWSDRLRVVGADFRAARDAFALVEATKTILQKEQRNLDILINNAAQTLTDSVAKEQKAIRREQLLLDQSTTEDPGKFILVVRQGYTARVRGGATGMISGQDTGLITTTSNNTSPLVAQTFNLQLSETSGPSSWVQSLSDIPVSSREDIFESQLDSAAKAGKHVRTNMSKAGLNMMTETEAATAWQQRKVAMNTVDPGYMSSAPEFEMAHGGERPIDWEDGAGRVLWPIAQHKRGSPIWGRFLKHHGAVRINTRFGRG
ncbi:hypothetical protein CSOJ01_07795 [Colletotrichum sojae]|uniref:Oxidoreductase n=1 Tax=Colletotrichum sojae TaxID=2175907 RepID=A0A8H6J7W9_9PEZI|nr:hypothetical protein CSOJ01_07795 [Colletotrichum sojae]